MFEMKILDRATDLANSSDPEYKTIRHVRTPAGAKRYGQPIGSIIVRDSVLDKIKILEPEWDGWDLVEGPGGKRYDVGYDEDTGKWIATENGKWDKVVATSDNEEDIFKNLNEKLGGKAKVKPNPKVVENGGFDLSKLGKRSREQYDALDTKQKREYLKARSEGEGHRAALDRAKGGSFTQGPSSRSGSNPKGKDEPKFIDLPISQRSDTARNWWAKHEDPNDRSAYLAARKNGDSHKEAAQYVSDMQASKKPTAKKPAAKTPKGKGADAQRTDLTENDDLYRFDFLPKGASISVNEMLDVMKFWGTGQSEYRKQREAGKSHDDAMAAAKKKYKYPSRIDYNWPDLITPEQRKELASLTPEQMDEYFYVWGEGIRAQSSRRPVRINYHNAAMREARKIKKGKRNDDTFAEGPNSRFSSNKKSILDRIEGVLAK